MLMLQHIFVARFHSIELHSTHKTLYMKKSPLFVVKWGVKTVRSTSVQPAEETLIDKVKTTLCKHYNPVNNDCGIAHVILHK